MKFKKAKRYQVIITYKVEFDAKEIDCSNADEVIELAENEAVTGVGEQTYEIYGENEESTDWESIEDE